MYENILWHIAEHIKPDLPTYCRLAAVNREFYRVFTSDRLWKQLNVYEVKNDIFGSFQKALEEPASDNLLRLIWIENFKLFDMELFKELTDNRFVWLGMMLMTYDIPKFCKRYKNLCKCAHLLRKYWVLDAFYPLNDREFAIEILAKAPHLLERFKKFHNDFDVVLSAVSSFEGFDEDFPCVKYASMGLKADPQIIAAAVCTDPRSVGFINQEAKDSFFGDRNWVLETVSRCPAILEYCDWYRDDIEVFRAAFSTPNPDPNRPLGACCDVLQYASTTLREDFELCKLALRADQRNITFCLNHDPQLLYVLFERELEDQRYDHTSDILENIESVWHSGSDVELHKLIVQSYRYCYGEFSEEIRKNEELAYIACIEYTENLSKVAPELLSNPEFLIRVLSHENTSKDVWEMIVGDQLKHTDVQEAALANGFSPTFIDNRAQTSYSENRESVMKYLDGFEKTGSPYPIEIPAKFHDDEQVMKRAVAVSGCALRQVSPRLCDDKEIVELAFQPTTRCSQFYDKKYCLPYDAVSQRLRNDKEFMRSLIEECKLAPVDWMQDEQSALTTIKYDCNFYNDIPEAWKDDIEFNCKAASANAGSLNFMKLEVLKNKKVQQHLKIPDSTVVYCGVCKIQANPSILRSRRMR